MPTDFLALYAPRHDRVKDFFTIPRSGEGGG